MALGRRQPKQGAMWVSSRGLAESPGHRFYEKLNELLAKHAFDEKTEALCAPFYEAAGTAGRPSIPPGVYFRMLLVGYFEGLESERGICWRCADSLSLRGFLGLGLTDAVPDQSTLSRTRKRLPEELFKQVFGLVLEMVAASGLLKGKVVGVDSTYLRADASMKSIVRRDTGESYADYIRRLAKEDGAVEPTVEDARRLDRSRAKTTSNEDWQSATDEDARIARLKDGRTRLAYKAEHVVDMDSGVIIDATVHPADKADAATIVEAAERARDVIDKDDDPPAPPTAASILPAGPVIEIVADRATTRPPCCESSRRGASGPSSPSASSEATDAGPTRVGSSPRTPSTRTGLGSSGPRARPSSADAARCSSGPSPTSASPVACDGSGFAEPAMSPSATRSRPWLRTSPS